jgi:ribosomal-protein-alanine N-acetyltransferase
VAFRVEDMDRTAAALIARWRYSGAYSFYDMGSDADDMRQFMDQNKWGDVYFAVYDERNEVAGFFEFNRAGEEVEIGLGLRPNLTGRGLGGQFVAVGLDFARRRYGPRRFRLAVAAFNERAVRVYERAGFARTGTHIRHLNGRDVDFIDMARDA